MASRRATRSHSARASVEPVEVTPRRGVITAQLPPIPSSINTSYGSPHSAMPVALRRRHDLRSAVGSALAAANEPIIEAPEPGGDSPEAEAPRAEAEEDGVLPPLQSSRQVTPTPDARRWRRRGSSSAAAPSDVDSVRSFAQESNIYGDATVLSQAGLGSLSADAKSEKASRKRKQQPELAPSSPPERPPEPQQPPEPRRSPRHKTQSAVESSPGLLERARQHVLRVDAVVSRRRHTLPRVHWLYPVAVLLILMFMMTGSRPSDPDTTGLRFYGWTDVRHNIGQFLPWWMSSRPVHIHLANGGDSEYLAKLSKFEYDINYLMKEGKLRKEAIQRLEALVPDFVHTQKTRSGQIKIPDEFWFALRDLIEKDDIILTLERGKKGDDISERHWAALKKRLEIDGGPSKSGGGLSEKDVATLVDSMVENRISQLWNKWLKSNDEAVRALLDNVQDAVDEAVKARLGGDGVKDAIVTKKEFIEHLRNEFLEHDGKIKGQLKDMDGRMHQMADALARIASQKPSTGGLTRKEVSAIVDDAFRKAVSRAQVEALARGQIQGFWASELSRQVNYFNPGSGAQIDRDHASAEYRTAISSYLGSSSSSSIFSFLSGGGVGGGASSLGVGSFIRRLVNAKPPVRALSDWSDDGDCWCVWPDRNSRATLGVLLPVPVIPTHIVVEHIDPARTVDPGAMPRDMQLWLQISDPLQRAAVRGWFGSLHGSEEQTLDDTKSDRGGTSPSRPYGDNWVEVARFRYEWRAADNGVLVHALPADDLVRLGAAADRVIVRVMTNHGDDHTCIYRVRLYGKPGNVTAT